MPCLLRVIYFIVSFSLLTSEAWGQNQTIENGANSTLVSFPGTRCVYNWTNDNPSIGLPSSGTGDIASFKAINLGSAPVTATITATPVNTDGFAYIANVESRTTGDNLNIVSVINTTTNQLVKTITVGEAPVGVSTSPDGTRVYVTNTFARSVSVIDTKLNNVVATIPVGSYPYGIVTSADGTRVFNTNFNDSNVSVINTATNTVIKTVPAGPNPYSVAINPNGTRLYVTNYYSNSVTIVNVDAGSVIATITTGTDPRFMAVSPDGNRIYVSNSGSNTISIINTLTNRIDDTIPVGFFPNGIALNSDGSRLYVKNTGDNTLYVIDTSTKGLVASIPTGRGGHGVALSPDGSRLYVTNSISNDMTVINTITNSVIATVSPLDRPFSPGNFVIGSSGCRSTIITITVNPTLTPVIIATGALAKLNTTYGQPSPSTYFMLTGSKLTENISLTAPAGFELSSDNITFSNTISIGAAGNLAAAPIYVRLLSGLPVGIFSGSILMSSAGAPSVSVTANGVVDPAMLSIQMSPVNKVYGTNLQTNSSSTSFIATGLEYSDKIESLTASFGEGASPTSLPGTYPNTIIGASARGGSFLAGNYSITYRPGNIIVTPAPLIIRADNKTKYLNEPNPTLTVSYSGFVNNENYANLTTQPNLSTIATQGSSPGQYFIDVSSALAVQYDITHIHGTLTILTIPSPENLKIPNTFTPNGDGKNDQWEISGMPDHQKCTLQIFGRTGQLVSNITEYKPWDGSLNGAPLPVGVYYYIIKLEPNSKPATGYVTILR